nr:hypothetical protein P5646_05575 [Bacillus velezensis]
MSFAPNETAKKIETSSPITAIRKKTPFFKMLIRRLADVTESLKNQFTYFYDHCPVFIEYENHFHLNHHIIPADF